MKKITLLYFYLFTVTLLAAPVNDNCANATTLTINSGLSCSTTSPGVFTAATPSSFPAECSLTAGADIWYQFTAEATSHTVALSNFGGTAQPVVMTLYEGADCNSLTQIYCSLNNVINATGLTVGTTYKLRIYFNLTSPSLTTTFSVCVNTPPPPSNNNQTDCLITTVNYDFELPPPPPGATGPNFVNHNTVQGWRTTASDQMMEFWPSPNYEGVIAYSGSQFIELNANLVSGVYQDYDTPQPTVFSYGFAHRGRQGTDTCQLRAGPPGGPYVTVQTVSTGTSAWSYNTGTYTVPAGQTTTRFIFQSVSSVGGNSVGNFLDAITFTANNGILSQNPFFMGCGDTVADISAAGSGTWVAHSDNPAPAVIADPNANDTTISGFGAQGTYYFDWVTEYCVSTLEIYFTGPNSPTPVVTNVTYCQNEAAVPLEAEVLPEHTLSWITDSGMSSTPPTPDTSTIGTTTYYVIQVADWGCESIAAPLTVTVSPPVDPTTTFTYTTPVCQSEGTGLPNTDPDFTQGGTFSSDTGLVIDGNTGEIDFEASTPGEYTVTYTVSSDVSCATEGSDTFDITIIAAPQVADVTTVQPDCETATGSITINNPLGAEYTYSIDGNNYQPNPVFTSLSAGDYTVYVQNTEGCESVLPSVTINDAPVVPTAPQLTVQQPNCNTTTGTITVTSPVGSNYTYSIDGTNFQSSPIFTDVATGDYTVTVLTDEGCEAVNNATINDAPVVPEVADVTTIQPDCDTATGSITINTPINADYTYSIDAINYQADTSFTGLGSGNYTVYVQSNDGCISELNNVVINAAPVVPTTPQVTLDQPDCDVFTGEITVNAPLGSDYTYSINGTDFQSSPIFTGVNPGNYTLTVESVDGCTATIDIAIDPVPVVPDVADITAVQPDCATPSGTITVNSPLEPGFTYSIDGTTFQSDVNFTGLSAGDYNVYVQNAQGCESVLTNVIIDPAPQIPATPQVNVTNPGCDDTVGAIEVDSPVGAIYTYSIDGVNFQPDPLFENVAPGNYTLTVFNGECEAVTSVTVNNPPLPPAAATVNVAQPECMFPWGTLTVVSPSAPGTTYSIDGVNFQPSGVFTGLPQGSYTVTVKNSFGCTSVSTNYIIGAPPIPATSPILSASDPTCTTHTGDIIVGAPVGAGYTYSIDGVNFQTGTSFTNLSPGLYTVLVQSPDGCLAGTSININPIPEIPAVPDVTIVQPDCASSTGSVTVTSPIASGLTYSADGVNFQQSAVFTGLTPGNHTISVRSYAGCIATRNIVINQGPDIPAQPIVTVTQPTCAVATGTITVQSPVGGGLQYSIDGVNYQAGTAFTGLASGVYTVTAQSTDGCLRTSSPITITIAPDVPAVPDLTINQPDCNSARGSITINSPVGAGYLYSMNNIYYQPGPFYSNLSPGNYTVYVKNSFGCTASVDFTIDDAPPVADSSPITGDSQVCLGETIELSNLIEDGVWSLNNENYATINEDGELTGIATGNVIVSYTVEEAGKCPATVEFSVWVTGPPKPDLRDIFICRDNVTGVYSIGVLDTGLSAADYTFEWMHGTEELPNTGSTLLVVQPGEYSVFITNRTTGCTAEVTATVGVSSAAVATATVGEDFNLSQSVTINVTGGSGIYEYQLDNGDFQDSPVFNGISPGEHTITIRDLNGCNDLVLTVYSLDYPRFFSPNGDGRHDTWNITSLSNQSNAKVYIFDRYGKLITMIKTNGEGWDGTLNGTKLPATDYWFTLNYQSQDGGEKEFKAHFSLLR